LGSLRLPAMAAPMTLVSTPALVAQACRAGILGAFPTSNAASEAQLEEWFDEIAHAAATPVDRSGPVGAICANLIVGRQNRRLDADVASVVRHRPPLIITSVGSPAPVVAPLHAAGCLVLADVASEAHAHKALEAGVDGLVLLAAGAGGHTGWANPLAFVRAVRAFYDGPLAVAGGMSDGTALWAAICAGFDLGLFGTRFIATPVSGAPAAWRDALVTATLDDITLADAPNGVPASILRSGVGSAGHAVSAVKQIQSVADVVDDIEASWDQARAATAAQLTTAGRRT
jgi:nitronate monooxygenase